MLANRDVIGVDVVCKVPGIDDVAGTNDIIYTGGRCNSPAKVPLLEASADRSWKRCLIILGMLQSEGLIVTKAGV